MGGDTGEGKKEYKMKKLFITLFQKNFYSEEYARKFIQGVKDNPFNDWCQWR